MARVLVVDDDPLCAAMMQQDLLRAGHRPLLVDSATAALIVLDAGVKVDLVVTDIMMPDMDGIELIRALRLRYPTLVIIAISSGGTPYNRPIFRMARVLGADRVLQKPVIATVMARTIDCLLREEPAFDSVIDRAVGHRPWHGEIVQPEAEA